MIFEIKKRILLLFVYLYSLVRGNANQVPPKIERVVVVQQAKLGDMVCTTPLFRALKNTYPSAHLTVVGNGVNKCLLEGNSDVDEYIVFSGFFATVTSLRKGNFNCALVTNPDFFSICALFFAGTPFIVAPSIEEGVTPLADMWYRMLLRLTASAPHQEGSYAPREYLRLLIPLGIHSSNTEKNLTFSITAEETANTYIHSLTPNAFVVGISPSAGNAIKEWPPERFGALANYLIKNHDAQIIVFGTKNDENKIRAMMEVVENTTHIQDAGGLFSIDELKAIISKLSIFIAVDTGPIYIAEAFRVPTVDIVGPVDERVQPPYDSIHRVVVPPGPRKPQVSVLNAKWYDRAEARKQAEATTLESVLVETESLIKELKIV